jgi:membrane-bound lytic murein transglycosylase B
MDKLKKLSLALAFSVAVSWGAGFSVQPAQAQTTTAADSAQEEENLRRTILAELREKARASGISESTIQIALHDSIKPRASVIRQDKNQAELRKESLSDYQRKRIVPHNISKGRDYLQRYRDIFDAAEAKTGVSKEIIAATWAIETNLGGYIGETNVIDNLFTLVYDGRRKDAMTKYLLDALKILDSGVIQYKDFIGSYAGAFGQPQFMPTSYLNDAVDGNGDGKIDLYKSVPDIIFSIANYHARRGWHPGERVSREVKLPPSAKAQFAEAAKNKEWKTLQEWKNLGVTKPDGSPIPVVPGMKARLVLPDPAGTGGSAHLGYHNYEVLMGYNPASKYVLTTQAFADIFSYKP